MPKTYESIIISIESPENEIQHDIICDIKSSVQNFAKSQSVNFSCRSDAVKKQKQAFALQKKSVPIKILQIYI